MGLLDNDMDMQSVENRFKMGKKLMEQGGLTVEDVHGPLPDWADRIAMEQCIEPMQQLYTKNGRARGNATLVRIKHVHLMNRPSEPVIVFDVVTDANNWIVYTLEELLEAYELGDYILKEFPNPKSNRNEHSAGQVLSMMTGDPSFYDEEMAQSVRGR